MSHFLNKNHIFTLIALAFSCIQAVRYTPVFTVQELNANTAKQKCPGACVGAYTGFVTATNNPILYEQLADQFGHAVGDFCACAK